MTVTFEDFRTAARALPEVEDATSYGTLALTVRGKLMARVHQDRDLNCCVLRIDLLDREMMIQAPPAAVVTGGREYVDIMRAVLCDIHRRLRRRT